MVDRIVTLDVRNIPPGNDIPGSLRPLMVYSLVRP